MSEYKSGFVAIVGKPNVGKSTLMNKILGSKISITSAKPQTTRQSVKGVYSDNSTQIVFLDTPGFVEPRYELHNKLLEYIDSGMKRADMIAFVSCFAGFPSEFDKLVMSSIAKFNVPKILLFNKSDLHQGNIADLELPNGLFDEIKFVSALKDDREDLVNLFRKYLPHSVQLYDPQYLTDMPMRFIVAEFIREQIFRNYGAELPYSVAVTIENYLEYEKKVEIFVNIWVERRSQKIIIIGSGGSGLAKIRQEAQKEIYRLDGRRVKLNLWVKIKPDWKKKKNALSEFGY